MSFSPHDLLPIKRPLEDSRQYHPLYFYLNVVRHLIKDTIRLEITGIPINLYLVRDLEKTIETVINNTSLTLKENKLVQDFLQEVFKFKAGNKIKESQTKDRDSTYYLKPYDNSNKVHRSYAVNYYLKKIAKESYTMESWGKKDVEKLSTLLVSNFIKDIINNNIQGETKTIVDEAMKELAEMKSTIYNKNRAKKLQDKLEAANKEMTFNPASSNDKRMFFQYLGIDAEDKTPAGQDKWNRAALEDLKTILDVLIEQKEKEHGQSV